MEFFGDIQNDIVLSICKATSEIFWNVLIARTELGITDESCH